MEIFTYIIQSLNNETFYTGISNSPSKRVTEHNRGKLSYTAVRRLWKLVYTKRHNSYGEARKHEKWLKKKNKEYKKYLAEKWTISSAG